MRIFRRLGTIVFLLSVLGLAACSERQVKIGAVISETGAVATYGQEVTRGLDLALEEINAAGGFKGPIELIYRDDRTKPDVGEQVVRDLIETEGVKMIIGAVSSPVTMAIAPICEKKGVLMISPTSSAPEISDLGGFIFRNYPSDILEGTAMADFAKKLGVRKIVVVSLDNAFGNGLTQVFIRQFKSKSRMVLKTFHVTEGDTSEFDAMVEQITELDPEAIYIVTYVDMLAELLKKLHTAGVKALMMGSASVTDRLPRLAGDAAEYLVYPQPNFDPNSEDEDVKAFVEAYRAKYQKDPDIYAAHGYDALKLLWKAMTNTGMSHPDEVRRGLNNLKGYQGAAGRTDFDERGDVVRYPTVFVIQDGQPIPYDRFQEQGGQLPAIADL